MKFDKDTVLMIVLCVAIVVGWKPLCNYMGWFQAAPAAENVSAAAPAVKSPPAAPAVKSVPAVPPPAVVRKEAAGVAARKPVVIVSKEIGVSIDPVAGEIVSVELFGYRNSAKDGNVVIDCTAGSTGAAGIIPGKGKWTTVSIDDERLIENVYTLTRRVSDANGTVLTLVQKWEVEGFVVRTVGSVINTSGNTVDAGMLLMTGGFLGPWQRVSGDKVRVPAQRLDYFTATGSYSDVKADAKESKFFAGGSPSVAWAAVSNKYFCMIMKGVAPFVMVRNRLYVEKDGQRDPFVSVNAQISRGVFTPGMSEKFDYSFYCGPKIIHNLDNFDSTTGRVMHLAWGPLDYLARLLLWILIKFHAFTGNYGWSIILLTLLVRIVFYPLTARGNASMKKMQLVQPRIKELREKYKDNPQLMNTKMMEIYRTEGISPFGGCLPILLQIPVFFALYATLDGAVELRQASFLWCRDLAAADTVARLNLLFFELPLNPLVLVMTLLMVVQQHMTPMSMDPMQKKMMLMMPIVMLFFFYDLPSGLTLYWTVSNVFSIIQLRLQQRKNQPLTANSSDAVSNK